MKASVSFLHYLNSERHKETLDKIQSLSFVHSYKVRKKRLACDDIIAAL